MLRVSEKPQPICIEIKGTVDNEMEFTTVQNAYHRIANRTRTEGTVYRAVLPDNKIQVIVSFSGQLQDVAKAADQFESYIHRDDE